jgi:ParB family chromosome partitioning protein
VDTSNNTDQKILQIPIEDIVPNRFQPRLAFDDSSLQELSDSIKEHGIIQPLVLRRVADKYEIIAGERRYRAAKMAGLTSVPAILSTMSDNESAEVAIVENVQRKDLTAIEEAKSYKALLDKGYISEEELAHRMGLSQSAISNKLRLLTLDESVQQAILDNKISERHGRSLLKIKDNNEQKKMLQRIINERLTVKQLENEIKKIYKDDVPVVSETNIDEIKNHATDIKPIQTEELMDVTEETPNKPLPPEKMPNKFFNFLEDYSANMDTTEDNNINIFNVEPEEENKEEEKQPTEEIEMLDDIIPVEKEEDDNSFLIELRELVKKNPQATFSQTDLGNKYEVKITFPKENN